MTVVVGTGEFTTRPTRLYELDVAATEAAAYEEARGSFLSRLTAVVLPFAADREVEPVLRVLPAGRHALAERLSALTRRPVSARVAMHDRSPVVFPGRVGAVVDEPGLIAALRRTALSGSGTVRVALQREAPAITTAEARGAAADARQLVSAPVRIRFRGDEVPWLWPRTLASLVRFQPSEGGNHGHPRRRRTPSAERPASYSPRRPESPWTRPSPSTGTTFAWFGPGAVRDWPRPRVQLPSSPPASRRTGLGLRP